jgi:hypothetical protein
MKKQAYYLLVIGLILVPGPGIFAQGNPQPVIEKMRSFAWMEGNWQGEAWYLGADRTKTFITQNEAINYKLDGAILIMEGTGSQKNEDTGEMMTVFRAFGVFTWNADESKYVLRAYRDGNYIDSDVIPNGDGSYSWFIDLPYGKTRYTLRHMDDGAWNEKGEFSRDGGENWMQIFEMTIRKI